MEKSSRYIPEEEATPDNVSDTSPMLIERDECTIPIDGASGVAQESMETEENERGYEMSSAVITKPKRIEIVPERLTDEYRKQLAEDLELVRAGFEALKELPPGLRGRTSDATIVNDPPIVPRIR